MQAVDLRRTSHILFFVVFLPACSWAIGWLFAKAFPDAPFWVETVSPLAAYGLLFNFFNNTAWHWPVFRQIGIVAVPDLRGRWLGEQVSSHKKTGGKHIKSRVIMEIEQTFSGIQVQTYYHQWHSSITTAQFVEIQNTPTLLYMFDSEPKADYDGDGLSHKGVTKLCQNPDKTLAGTCFNAAGGRGELRFRRTKYKLYRTFDAVKD